MVFVAIVALETYCVIYYENSTHFCRSIKESFPTY